MAYHRSGSIISRIILGIMISALICTAINSGVEAQEFEIPAPGQSPTVDRVTKNGVLRLGVAVAAPWLFQDPRTGEYLGASIFLGEKIAEALGVELELVESNWNSLIAAQLSGKFDVNIAPTFATPEREEVVSFVNYALDGNCYFALKTNDKITDLSSLNDPSVVIATKTGTGNEQGVINHYPKATIRSLPPPPGGGPLVEEVLSGRADVSVINGAEAVWVAEAYPQLKFIPGGPEGCVANPDIPFPIGLSYQKGDDAFGAFAQRIVDYYQDDINALIVKYSGLEWRDVLGE